MTRPLLPRRRLVVPQPHQRRSIGVFSLCHAEVNHGTKFFFLLSLSILALAPYDLFSSSIGIFFCMLLGLGHPNFHRCIIPFCSISGPTVAAKATRLFCWCSFISLVSIFGWFFFNHGLILFALFFPAGSALYSSPLFVLFPQLSQLPRSFIAPNGFCIKDGIFKKPAQYNVGCGSSGCFELCWRNSNFGFDDVLAVSSIIPPMSRLAGVFTLSTTVALFSIFHAG